MLFVILILITFWSSFISGADQFSCASRPSQKNTSAILAELRRVMQEQNISIYVIFSDDEHGSEYTQQYDKRRDWVTGVSSSQGTAVVSWRSAALWLDSRYFTQAEEQLDCANWLLMREGNPGVPDIYNWLVSEANETSLVGFPFPTLFII